MKTNKLMDDIRKSTPADTNKQVDLCVAIANRVFELLQERNMKQRDFAKALGKTETEVSRWLSGTHNLTLATIAKMATVLGDDIITTTQSHRPYKQMVRTLMKDGLNVRPEDLRVIVQFFDKVNGKKVEKTHAPEPSSRCVTEPAVGGR